MMMISDMFFKVMMTREALMKNVGNLPRKQKQHRDLQRRGVREEHLAVRVAAVYDGLQGLWQRGSPGSERGCGRRRRRHYIALKWTWWLRASLWCSVFTVKLGFNLYVFAYILPRIAL